MQPIRHWTIATVLIGGALAASTCGGDKPTTPTAPTPSTPSTTTPATPTATSLEIEGPSELEVGETVQYQAMVTYSDGETKRVTDDVEWVSGNTTVATVDSDGRVTGRRAGGFDLRATAEGVTGRKTGIRVEPPPGPEQTFNRTFWGRLIYNAYDKPDGLTGRVSWVMPTTSPNVYIRTKNVDASALAHMRREIPRIVEAVTGHPFAGRVDHGPDDYESTGWITIRVVTVDEAPEFVRGYCGYAWVGADPGSLWLSPWESGCDGTYPARMLVHEMGHALGLNHVPDADAVMKQYAWTVAFSAGERHHSELAYVRGRGTPYGDGSTFAPSRRGVVGRPVGVAD